MNSWLAWALTWHNINLHVTRRSFNSQRQHHSYFVLYEGERCLTKNMNIQTEQTNNNIPSWTNKSMKNEKNNDNEMFYGTHPPPSWLWRMCCDRGRGHELPSSVTHTFHHSPNDTTDSDSWSKTKIGTMQLCCKLMAIYMAWHDICRVLLDRKFRVNDFTRKKYVICNTLKFVTKLGKCPIK